MIDPFAPVYPMVGPGAGDKEMLTGDWITSRDGKKPVCGCCRQRARARAVLKIIFKRGCSRERTAFLLVLRSLF